MSTDHTNFTAKSFLRDRYLAQQTSDLLRDPSFRYNAPSSSLPKSAKSFADPNVSACRSVTRCSPEPPSEQNAVRDAWCEVTAVKRKQATSAPEADEISTEKMHKMFSWSDQKAFFIGLSLGLMVLSTALVIALSLWLSHSG